MGIESIPTSSLCYLVEDIRALPKLKEETNYKRFCATYWVKSCSVYNSRGERFAGESKYPLKKMLFFALDGITSFSVVPLRIITVLGFFIFIFSLMIIIWILMERVYIGSTIQGGHLLWSSIYPHGGEFKLMSPLGFIGEYIWGEFSNSQKDRPRYIIDREI